jgi:DNA polymerase-1
MSKKKFVIIDGNAIIHRAYYALPPMTVKDGTMVNAVYGFTSMLLKVINDINPDYLAVSFDVAGGTFRSEVYEDYKATRVKADQELYDQIPLVYEVVKTLDIPIYTKKGYEADDIIGTVTKKIKNKKNIETVIVTGDMDMLQLVDDNVKVYELRKGLSDIVLFDEKKVKEKYGFGPDMVVDYKALRGDTSDNIPGIKGIGEKTAKELIEKIGGIDEIYKDIKNKDSKLEKEFKPGVIEKIKTGKKDAEMSRELATIHQDVKGFKFKLNDCVIRKFNEKKVKDLFHKFEFFSLLKRVPGMKPDKKTEAKKKVQTFFSKKLTLVGEDNFENFLNKIKKEEIFSCAESISGKDILNGELGGLAFLFGKEQYYIDFKKINDKQKKELNKIFENKDQTIVGHDLKQLVKALSANDIEVKNKLFDVMIASYVINSGTRAHDLKSLVMRELNKELPSINDQASLFGVDPKLITQRLIFIFELYNKLKEELKEKEDLGLFEKMEMKLIPVLADMELNGVAIDKKVLSDLSEKVNSAIKKLITKIHKEAGEEFNVASSVQLREILFEKMKLPTEGIKKGKTGYSTAASELEKLHGQHDIIEMIEEFREMEKLRNTYIDVLPGLVNKKTNRIHTNFNQAVTTTGRLSSSDPNLQNIPIRTEMGREIRETFIAEKGNVLVAADYSQIELRIVASLAQDKKMIEIFNKGEDIHKATAAIVNNVELDEVTKKMRYAAKEVNFGVLYGMGAYGLAWRTKMPQWQAKEFINKYFEQFSSVKKYIDETLKFAKKEGYVETLFGRRRYIPELSSSNFQLRSAGERMAINMPIQGTAADLMKMAMIGVYEEVKSEYSKEDVRVILQVHDEIVLEVKKGLEKKVAKLVKDVMENITKLRVPIDVDSNIGKRWGDMK